MNSWLLKRHGSKYSGKPLLPGPLRPDGGAEGVRTPDLLNAIQALYQLSYDPVQSERNLICPMRRCQNQIPQERSALCATISRTFPNRHKFSALKFPISNLQFFYDFAINDFASAGFVIICEIRVFSLSVSTCPERLRGQCSSVVKFFLVRLRRHCVLSKGRPGHSPRNPIFQIFEFVLNVGFRVSNFRTVAATANPVYN
jgi:hypothetical protein